MEIWEDNIDSTFPIFKSIIQDLEVEVGDRFDLSFGELLIFNEQTCNNNTVH